MSDPAANLVVQLCDAVEAFAAAPDEPIAAAIARKRAQGGDPAFEALLRTPWMCPRCLFTGTVLDILVPDDDGDDAACPACGEGGIAPVVAS